MAFNFLPYEQDQLFLMPPSVQEWVGEGSLARFTSEVVEELDGRGRLRAFYDRYRGDGWGHPAYHPRMLVKVLVYGYAVGVRSSRKLAQALEEHVGFRYLAANQQPDFRTISDFRKLHLEALEGLFAEVLGLCREAGLVQLGRVALDGRRLPGNASLYRNRTKAELRALAEAILREAEETDAQEDERLGEDQRGDELPPGLRTPQERLKRIRAALDVQAQKAAEVKAKGKARQEARDKRPGRRKGREPQAEGRERDKEKAEQFRANTTDADSRVLSSRHGRVQGYNGQALVDCRSQVIVAEDVTNAADDRAHLALMLARCVEQNGQAPAQCLADAGYWSDANARAGGATTELFIAVDREDRTLRGDGEGGGGRSQTPAAEAMRAKLRTPQGRAIYRERSRSAEPVFGQMCMRNLNRFWLRGLRKVRVEWSLFCTTHDLLKLWRSGWRPQPA